MPTFVNRVTTMGRNMCALSIAMAMDVRLPQNREKDSLIPGGRYSYRGLGIIIHKTWTTNAPPTNHCMPSLGCA